MYQFPNEMVDIILDMLNGKMNFKIKVVSDLMAQVMGFRVYKSLNTLRLSIYFTMPTAMHKVWKHIWLIKWHTFLRIGLIHK